MLTYLDFPYAGAPNICINLPLFIFFIWYLRRMFFNI
jgi:hypothetical protein